MIKIGVAGNCAENTLASIRKVDELGLDSQEIEFVRGIYMKNESAREVGDLAKKLGVILSVHAPYYINLVSLNKDTARKSKGIILTCCERAHYLKAKNVVFHTGYYMKRDKKEVFNEVVEVVRWLKDKVREKGFRVDLCPETMGKVSSFGSMDEVVELVKKVRCSFCVDFAHIYARQNGRIDYENVLDSFRKLKKEMHCHFSGIEYGEKGERRHLDIDSRKPDFRDLAKVLLKKKVNCNIICESPRQVLDSLDMKKIIDGMN